MKRLIVGLVLAFGCFSSAVHAEPWNRELDDETVLADLFPQPTQEVWFYLQEMRRHDDPQQAIRRAAEFKAAARRLRIETRKWYGYSPARPNVPSVPMMVNSPAWSGTDNDPYRWVGGGVLRVATVVEVEPSTTTK